MPYYVKSWGAFHVCCACMGGEAEFPFLRCTVQQISKILQLPYSEKAELEKSGN